MIEQTTIALRHTTTFRPRQQHPQLAATGAQQEKQHHNRQLHHHRQQRRSSGRTHSSSSGSRGSGRNSRISSSMSMAIFQTCVFPPHCCCAAFQPSAASAAWNHQGQAQPMARVGPANQAERARRSHWRGWDHQGAVTGSATSRSVQRGRGPNQNGVVNVAPSVHVAHSL